MPSAPLANSFILAMTNSVVRALGDRFPIEFASSLEPEDDDQVEESDGSEFQFEIIDESDLEPESDEEDDQ